MERECAETDHAGPLPFISLPCSHFVIIFTVVFWVEVFNTLCWAKMEKMNTSVKLYCLYHFREKRKVAVTKVTDWIRGMKGVFTLVRAFSALLIYVVDCILVFFLMQSKFVIIATCD